jgi:chemotaxis protein MotB
MSEGGGSSLLQEDHEEHENHERWLITYADMITLLMAFFIMLFAMSQLDLAKFKEFQQGVAGELGGSGLVQGGTGLLPEAGQGRGQGPGMGPGMGPGPGGHQERIVAEQEALDGVQAKLEQAARSSGSESVFLFEDQRRGLSVQIRGGVLFAPGAAELSAQGKAVLNEVAAVVQDLPNPLLIEGHTDNVPIVSRYADNWELSSARALSVLRFLSGERGIVSSRLSAAGYGDQHPVASNDTPQGRARNRRVEIVVLAMEDEEARRPRAEVIVTPSAKPDAAPASSGH